MPGFSLPMRFKRSSGRPGSPCSRRTAGRGSVLFWHGRTDVTFIPRALKRMEQNVPSCLEVRYRTPAGVVVP